MKVILISGKAGSGKDEVANIIKEELPNSVVTSLSKYIKLIAQETTNWDGSDQTKPRQILQEIGDMMRAENTNFLIKRIEEDFKIYERLHIENVIISDIRLINEIEYFKNNNKNCISIRVNSSTSKRVLTEEEKHHCTELELDNYPNFDYIIKNEFNEKLKEEVIKILKGMK